MKCSIVIPTYNHCDDLLKPCIESIFKYTRVSDIELIVSANGCVDNTLAYLGALKEKYDYLGLSDNLKIVWNKEALGFSRATNAGIEVATTDYILLLNNDTVLLHQYKNQWIDLLTAPFIQDSDCGISCVIKSFSEPAGQDFAIFFCVMIHRKVFDKIGLLNTDYGVGGGEDTEFSIECERAGFKVIQCLEKEFSHDKLLYVGNFPIYHAGEGTMHDPNLVPEWSRIFDENSIRLAKKYNPAWYKWAISNNAERGVFFKDDEVYPREKQRYQFAADNLSGKKVLEIGCSSGFGVQFLPEDVDYTGIDYSNEIIEAAKEQNWRANAKFICADVNQLLFSDKPLTEYYDTIIAYETIEHIRNGLEIVEKLKMYCDRLFITVPYNEQPGQFSPHHYVHNLTADKFKGFTEIGIIDLDGSIISSSAAQPNVEYNLLLVWQKDSNFKSDYPVKLSWLRDQHEEIYKEVIVDNVYNVKLSDFEIDRDVIDIGANNGTFSIMTSYMGAKNVLSVEPVRQTFDLLMNNIQKSKLENIKAVKKLVSNIAGEKHKVSLNPNSGHNSMYNVQDDYEEVETVTLPDLLAYTTSDKVTLKIDCEGAEYDILMNATPEEMTKVDKIILEVHAELHPTYKGFDILNNKVKELGFNMVDHKQVYVWYYNNNGEVIDMKPIPYRVEMWEK